MKSFALTLTHPEPIGESLPRFDSGYNQFLSELGAKLRVNRGAEGPGEIPQILIFKTLRMTAWRNSTVQLHISHFNRQCRAP